MPDDFARWAADNAVRLETLDPAAPLDDLEPLAARFRAARVVAIGESAHWVREFSLLRHRLLRFLVERCGFTAFGFESGFSEGLAVNAWIGGGPGDLDTLAEHGITYRMGRSREMRAQLEWMRTASVPFIGLDVPGSAASPMVALANVRRFAERADPDAVPLVDRLVALAEKYTSEHAFTTLTAYAQLDAADRDAMTAGLAELSVRLDVSGSGAPEGYDVVRHELRLVRLLDQDMRGYAAQVRDGASFAVSARDLGMAETVLRALDRFGPDTRIVIGAANNHIQRVPVRTPGAAIPVAGHHLANRLGKAYLAVAVTSTGGTTTTRRADRTAPGGVAVVGAPLGPPEDGSVEAALSGLSVVDLAAARGRTAGPDAIRVMDTYQPTPVLDAFDLVVNIPEITPADHIATAGSHTWSQGDQTSAAPS